ncbi:MAG: sporulation protein YqfD [Firmicutes bacterium]|nr:sporulation protein YqfD [Bacillota bacterium]
MLLWLWKVLRGYVKIEVRGAAVERFINMAVHKNIYLWDVEREDGVCTMKVSIKGFRMLRECQHKTKSHVRILARYGLPFFLHRYRRRKFLFAGLVVFILALAALQSFVWLVDVTGCERVSRDAVLAYCGKEGLSAGSFRIGLDGKKLAKGILDNFPDVTWANVYIRGTRATIEIAEAIPRKEVIDASVPCDVVAAKDGLITSIVTAAGRPLVKENDTVRKGDVIVSGRILADGGDGAVLQKNVRASAEVWAKTYYTITFDVPYAWEEKVYTGEEQKRHEFLIFNRKIGGFRGSNSYVNCDKITSRFQLRFGEDYPLPFIIVTETSKEFMPVRRTRTKEQAEALADRLVTGRIIREFDFAADILDKKLTFTDNGGSLGVSALITVNERIDEQTTNQ